MHPTVDPATQTQTLYIPFASPPTPCPSPRLDQPVQPSTISYAAPSPARRRYLATLLLSCTPAELLYISTTIAPLLKRDFLAALPAELGVHILAFIDDPRTLVRAGMVSTAWHLLASDHWLWRRMCSLWGFLGDEAAAGLGEDEPLEEMEQFAELPMDPALEWLTARKRKARRVRLGSVIPSPSSASSSSSSRQFSYKDYFKESYITMMNWRHGGHLLRSHRLPALSSSSVPDSPHQHHHNHQHHLPSLSNPYLHPNSHPHPQPTPTPSPVPAADTGVVTSLALDSDWVVVGLAGSRIHVFSARTGVLARTLVGHDAGVWGVCLVSRGGSQKVSVGEYNWRKWGGMEEVFEMMDLGTGTSSERPLRPGHTPPPTLNGPTDGFITVTGKKGNRGKGKARAGDEDTLEHLVPPGLRIALGLDPDGGGGFDDDHDPDQEQEPGDAGIGVGGRGVVDEDAEDDVPRPTTPTHVPERQSDPCFASEGWGQPNALVVSGGCDKVVRVWDVKSGHLIYTLPGHTSTIRCMRVLHGRPIAVTGSRDGTVRVWDVQRGRALRCLRGHGGSVRCLDVNGRRAVSGSYDTTCRLWNIDTGECIHILRGHFSQIYSVAFDGVRVASGGLDTTVRVWNAETGHCTALLQGHTALVCQLQLSPLHSILATGGSDGRVITFSLSSFLPLHRIAAHDSSVTALQFDGRFLVTGGNDGRVRLFETASGRYVRELSDEGECVWKVGYAGGTCAVMGKRAGKTVMEIWSFRPKEEGSA